MNPVSGVRPLSGRLIRPRSTLQHGLTGNGNDRLHIAVNLVRQDGRRVQLPLNDLRLAQEVRKRIEQTREFVLPLHDAGRAPVRSLPGYTMAEHAQAKEWTQQPGQGVIPDRVLLQQMVRAASVAAAVRRAWQLQATDPMTRGRGERLQCRRPGWCPRCRAT